MRDHKLYLDDILECIQNIEMFIQEVEYESFVTNKEKLFAVKHALLIIGEAANKLPDDVKIMHPEIQWRDIIGLRNKIVHDYFGLQVRLIWKISNQDIPELKRVILKMLDE